MRALYIFILMLLFSSSVFAQQKKYVWGYLRDSVTNEPIALASVTNLNTQHTVMTSNKGLLKIAVAQNQVLSFAAVGYHFDTVLFQQQLLIHDTLYLQLVPLTHSLGNVTVKTKGMNAYQLDSIERRKDFFEDIVQYKMPAVAIANSGAGIALNIDRFSRKEKNKRKAFQFFETNEREAYINYRFPAQLVNQYTGFTNDVLQEFMEKCRPSYEWLRANTTEEDIKYYINEQLKKINNKK